MADLIEEESPGVPEWVVTYGDMMSLLLTFFIMLVSLSEMGSDGKVRAMMDAIREAFGPTVGQTGVPGPSLQRNSAFDKMSSDGLRSNGGLKKASRKSKGRAGANKTVQRLNHGTIVTMGGPTLFKRFDAELTPALKESLDVIARVLSKKPNHLVVRGHASPEPLPENSEFADQMDLSFQRAKAAADYLISKGIDSQRVYVSAVGDAEPRIQTRQKSAQKLNRRVDIFLIDSYITALQ